MSGWMVLLILGALLFVLCLVESKQKWFPYWRRGGEAIYYHSLTWQRRILYDAWNLFGYICRPTIGRLICWLFGLKQTVK